MAKKKQQETQEPTLESITVSIGTEPKLSESLVGKIISINLKKESFFGVGDIWLTPDKYWAKIPETLTKDQYEIIARSLKLGTIVLGKKFIPPVDKVSSIPEKYWSYIEKTGFENKQAKQEFLALWRKGLDQGWTALEIGEFCMEKEKKLKKRKEVIRLLKQFIDTYDGPISLYDPPDDDEGIKKVIISSDGTIEAETNSGKKVAKQVPTPKPPAGHVKGTKSAEEAVDDLLG